VTNLATRCKAPALGIAALFGEGRSESTVHGGCAEGRRPSACIAVRSIATSNPVLVGHRLLLQAAKPDIIRDQSRAMFAFDSFRNLVSKIGTVERDKSANCY